ncbi:MAG: hypothetical protein AB8B63_06435 [Granulosicoccus sp.]
MDNNVSDLSTANKALRLNLDAKKYGTIAEIGAGQEVARQFFLAGAAAGTVAKTISAYDMQFSDAIYGTQAGGRYVSRERVRAMLDKEFELVVSRVGTNRAKASRYFSYAATVSAKSFNRDNECHAWCGVRLQMYPGAEPSDVIVHVRMLENTAELQQQTLGVLGVNLIYGAYYYYEEPRKIIESLTDNLGEQCLEIDSIEFYGPYFDDLDNRAENLHLISSSKAHAVMFSPDGKVVVPAEMLYKKNVLTIRGSFKPVTRLNIDMIEQGFATFLELDGVDRENTIVLTEISLRDGLGKDRLMDEQDLISRVELLNSLGYSVMVSDYARYFSLRAYFRQFTSMQIGIVLGMINVSEIFDQSKYTGVEGGILEGFGKLFPDNTRLFVYPELDDLGSVKDFTQIEVPDTMRYLFQHLLHNKFIFGIECSNPELLRIYSREVLAQLQGGRGEWENALHESTVAHIVEQGLFGYREFRKAG